MTAMASFDKIKVLEACLDQIQAIKAERKRQRKKWIVDTVSKHNTAWYNRLMCKTMSLREGVLLAKREEKANYSCSHAYWTIWAYKQFKICKDTAVMCFMTDKKTVLLDHEAVSMIFK